ncbi:MAG: efflux RND transporter periplasmic adaptor subunit [Bacteroidaceae bacterium]|nr:efflux RND transporter periplasmic adaptor subunit [Bacteroidaceae bacterium]
MKTTKGIIPVLCSVMLFCACRTKQEKTEEETLAVVVERVTPSSDVAQIPYVGVVEEESSTTVSFTGMAVLQTMTVSEGQAVKKGQLLAVIDETQARNTLATTKAALDQAKDAYERMKLLHDNQSLADMKWVEVESKVQQAQSAYDMAKKNLDDCRIYAPVSGVVGTKIMSVGETVLPTEPVLTILSIDRVKVRVAIPEREIAGITAGTATQITVDALGDEVFQGGKIEKGVSADPLTHTYDIRITVPNPGHKLLPGMVARVKMRNGVIAKRLRSEEEQENEKMRNEGVVTLPVKAVQQATDKTLFVWVPKDGKAHRTPVTIGQTVGNRVVIESGLQEGDQVIVEGYQKVGEGTPVKYGME